MKYLAAMVLAFISGAYQVKVAAELANDGSVTAWVGVAILGCLIFYTTIVMALVSVQAERAEQLLEESGR